MAINLAKEYSKKIDERFALTSKTDAGAGHDYTFSGVNEISVYSIDTVALNNYSRTASANRFGTVAELGDTIQTMSLTKDRSFTFAIDAGNAAEQFNIKQANACLKREWDEVCTPEIDTYRLNAWATGNGLSSGNAILTNATKAALTKSNIFQMIVEGAAAMSDEKVPLANRTIYISELDYVKFKLADEVMKGTDLTDEMVRKGYRGTIDGMSVVTVPSSYMPTNCGFIIKVKGATVDPVTLKNLRVQKNPMGIDGDVVEGRFIYDSFVLDSKCKGIYAYMVA